MKLNKPNYSVEVAVKSFMIKPILKAQINDEYLSWINNESITEYLVVGDRAGKIKKNELFDYVNERRSQNCEVFGVFSTKDKQFVGTCGLIDYKNSSEFKAAIKTPSKNNSFNHLSEKYLASKSGPYGFGIMIGNEVAQSFGAGAETYVALINFIFRILREEVVFIGTVSSHERVVSMLKRFSFKKICDIKDYVKLKKSIEDLSVYYLSKESWLQNKNPITNLNVTITDI